MAKAPATREARTDEPRETNFAPAIQAGAPQNEPTGFYTTRRPLFANGSLHPAGVTVEIADAVFDPEKTRGNEVEGRGPTVIPGEMPLQHQEAEDRVAGLTDADIDRLRDRLGFHGEGPTSGVNAAGDLTQNSSEERALLGSNLRDGNDGQPSAEMVDTAMGTDAAAATDDMKRVEKDLDSTGEGSGPAVTKVGNAALDKASAADLRSYLDSKSISYPAKATQAELLALAKKG